MKRLKIKMITFYSAASLLLLGGCVFTVRADPPEPMPPLPWSSEEQITPLIGKASSEVQQEDTNSISNAFQLSFHPSMPKEANNDIAEKLKSVSTQMDEIESRPYASRRDTPVDQANPTILQLERIAADTKTIHALGRLINRCQNVLTADLASKSLSDKDRQSINHITAWAYTTRGQARYNTGQFDEAIHDFTAATVFDPFHLNAYLIRGTINAELATHKSKQEALTDFNQVLNLKPDHLIALKNRATLLLELKEPGKALQDGQQGIDIWSEQSIRSADLIVSLHELAGNALLQLNRRDEAIEAYSLALRYDQESSIVRLRRGALLAALGEYQLAIDDLLASLKSPKATNLESAEAYRCLAWLLATCPDAKYRDPHKAVESANRAVMLSTADNPNLYATLAIAHAAAGDFEQAITYQQKVVLATTAVTEHESALQRLNEFKQGIVVELANLVESKNLRHANYQEITQ